VLLLLQGSAAQVVFDRNTGLDATPAFRFKSVLPPAKDDAATHASLALVVGARDPNSAQLRVLTDGLVPANEDQPRANFFFRDGSHGGRIRLDLGSVIEISQVNTYSWHSNTRAPQFYNLYASDGSAPDFNSAPDEKTHPADVGWILIATVYTIPREGAMGGQFGVRISAPGGSLGKFRYLLFDCIPTEYDDPWGNTFFSEIDVLK
jgi:hypothetical protein